jgi:hypothetical protein
VAHALFIPIFTPARAWKLPLTNPGKLVLGRR